MSGWNPRSTRTFVRQKPNSPVNQAVQQSSTDPWSWFGSTSEPAREPEAQRLSFQIRRLAEDPRQLAVDMRYEDGRPVHGMPYKLSDKEREATAFVLTLPRSYEDSLFILSGPAGRRALSYLVEHMKLTGPSGRRLTGAPAYTGFEQWQASSDGTQKFVLVKGRDAELLHNAGGPWILDAESIAPVSTTIDPEIAYRLAMAGPLPAERSQKVAADLSAVAPQAAPAPIRINPVITAPTPKMILDRDGDVPVARIAADYDGIDVADLGAGGEMRSYDPDNGVVNVIRRDPDAERRILAGALDQGLVATDDPSVHHFSGKGGDIEAAIYEESQRERLEHAGWTVGQGPRWDIRTRRIGKLELRVALGLDEPGYVVDLMGDGQTIEFIDPLTRIAEQIPEEADDEEAAAFLQRHVRDGDAAVRADDGRVWLMPAAEFVSLVTTLRRILMAPRAEGQPLRTDLYSIADLAEISADIGLGAPESLARLFSLMRSGEASAITWPHCFTGERDEKQLQAAAWLRTLFEAGYGGILADEVGFGKTIEIGLHIASLREEGLLDEGALIAVPNNAVSKWKEDLAHCFPDMPVLVWHENSRPTPAEGDIVITSHDLVKRDSCPLGHRRWTLVALDEAQDAKKPTSQLAFVIASIEAVQKVPVTASPIENSLEDLWTLMNIANPGLLGALPAYRKVIVNEVEKANVVAANRINALTAPFIMSRIDPNRPMPVIQDVIVDLNDDQKEAYKCLLSLKKKKFEKRIERVRETGMGASQLGMSIMLSMTRERQVCCSPLLLPNGVSRPTTPYAASAKTKAIVDHARRFVNAGKRIIVFSQWTSHLDLIASAMHSMEISTVSYDGRMTHRDKKASMAAFKAHEADVILMTTKSGGRALDMNEADAIFFADPWWNPKVERQAIGRATRRGQSKTIEVYRFLTMSPIEQVIMNTHHKKDGLSNLITPGRIVESCEGMTISDIDAMLRDFDAVGEDLRLAA